MRSRLKVAGLKAQDWRKMKREVRVVKGQMHNLMKDGMSVSEINILLYTRSYVVADRLGKKKGNKLRRRNPKTNCEEHSEMAAGFSDCND